MATRVNLQILIFLCFCLAACKVLAQNISTEGCCKKVSHDFYEAYYDMQAGIFKNYPGIHIVEKFVGSGCSAKGVIKLTISKDVPSQQKFLFDMYVSKPQGWVFNLGDSSTNNGWGGDAGTQSRDAEMHLYNGVLSGYYSDFYGSGKAFEIPMNPVSRISCIVGDSFSMCTEDCNMNTANYFTSPGWFALAGQEEISGPKNYDLYLGINRVIGTGGRIGSGICRLGIKYLTNH